MLSFHVTPPACVRVCCLCGGLLKSTCSVRPGWPSRPRAAGILSSLIHTAPLFVFVSGLLWSEAKSLMHSSFTLRLCLSLVWCERRDKEWERRWRKSALKRELQKGTGQGHKMNTFPSSSYISMSCLCPQMIPCIKHHCELNPTGRGLYPAAAIQAHW